MDFSTTEDSGTNPSRHWGRISCMRALIAESGGGSSSQCEGHFHCAKHEGWILLTKWVKVLPTGRTASLKGPDVKERKMFKKWREVSSRPGRWTIRWRWRGVGLRWPSVISGKPAGRPKTQLCALKRSCGWCNAPRPTGTTCSKLALRVGPAASPYQVHPAEPKRSCCFLLVSSSASFFLKKLLLYHKAAKGIIQGDWIEWLCK